MSEQLHRAARVSLALLLVASVGAVGVLAFPGVIGAESSYVVLSGSMRPAIQPGDTVVVRSVDPGDVGRGDIVVFHTDGSPGETGPNRVTHRVVETVRTDHGVAYRTKGDANDSPDQGLVDHSELVGEVWFHVPFVGRIFLLLQRPVSQLLLVVVPGLLLLAGGWQSLREQCGGSRHTESSA